MSQKRSMVAIALAISLAALLLCAGCRTARMDLGPQLSQQASELPVKGHMIQGLGQPFSIGPYGVQDVSRGWTVTTAWGFLGYESFNAEQEFEFVLKPPQGEPWRCSCATGVDQEVLEGMVEGGTLTIELSTYENFACTFKPGAGGPPWRMALSRSQSQIPMRGVLTGGQFQIQMQGSYKLEGSSIPLSDPTGYFFIRQAKSLGAIEVINQGALWLVPGLGGQTKEVLAAASAALLLYQDISRD